LRSPAAPARRSRLGAAQARRHPAHGTLRQTDPLERRDGRKLTRHIEAELQKYLDQIRRAGFDRIIGTSGTI